jgi:hypothetical protein
MAEFENPAFEEDVFGPDDDDVFSDSITAAAAGTSLRSELLRSAVDTYYRDSETQPLLRDYTKFDLGKDGTLRLKDYPDTQLTNKRTGRPLALSTIANRSGAAAVREGLGLDFRKSSLSTQAVAKLQNTAANLPSVDTVPLQDLGRVANEAHAKIETLTTALSDEQVTAALSTMESPPLNLRELRGLDRALQTIRGELVNNLAKLSDLDNHITLEKQKLEDAANDEFSRRRIAERLRSLQDERAARVEAASASRDALRSQINRVRETINRILHENTTLAQRLKTLFREQGVTIASVITALGFIISTVVLAIGGGGGPAGAAAGAGAAGTAGTTGTAKEWLKKHLHSLGQLLANLAGKTAAALPGIIGSVVSWLLSFLSKSVGWMADHVWALVGPVAGVLYLMAYRAL